MNDDNVRKLIRDLIDSRCGVFTFTWVNHYSCLINISNKIDVRNFDFVGVDGQFLAFLLCSKIQTTAADRVLPLVLSEPAKVFLIGGTPDKIEMREEVFYKKFPDIDIVGNFDGYTRDLFTSEFLDEIIGADAEIIIIGTGSPRQESLALFLKTNLADQFCSRGLSIVTCGGWLDQILLDAYYPKWSYKLRLNWIVRLCREPRRLWKRYTYHALLAMLQFRKIRNYLTEVAL